MLTPQEIQEKSGSFEKAVFGGYSMSSVEDLLIPMQEDYAALYKENAVLKSKMKVLVDRLEEYRAQEESMNRAILTAQKTADDLMAETQRKCAAMVADSELRLRQRSEDLQKELQKESEEAERSKAAIQKEVMAEREKADKIKADIQRELQAEAQKAVKARTELHKEVLAESERVSLAKTAAADFIVKLEDQFQTQLSQLERIKQMDLRPKDSDAKAASKPPITPAKVASKPTIAPAKAASEPPITPAKAEKKPAPVSQDTVVLPAKPKAAPTEDELSREIEGNISRILAASAQAEYINKPDDSGDTKVITPV